MRGLFTAMSSCHVSAVSALSLNAALRPGLRLLGWVCTASTLPQEALLMQSCPVSALVTPVAFDPRRYLQNITIPAAFVQRSVGDSLKQLIKPQKDLPHPKVLVSLDWTDLLPRNEVVSDGCASRTASASLRSTAAHIACLWRTLMMAANPCNYSKNRVPCMCRDVDK